MSILENGNWIWLIYWGFFLVALIFELILIFKLKKHKWIPIMGVIVTVIAPICNLFFAMQRGIGGPHEFIYLYQQIISGNGMAWVCISLLVLTVLFFIWSISNVIKLRSVFHAEFAPRF
ncbi:hypothetical protein, partial [Ileibacterium valens]|uniref:hypothetical protein n=1 Tax=Ileibacterium valens TaxID=1862668 RepID=UPI0027295801